MVDCVVLCVGRLIKSAGAVEVEVVEPLAEQRINDDIG